MTSYRTDRTEPTEKLLLEKFNATTPTSQKHFSEIATYLASFSVTYLAISLKLAKFSVTERMADVQLSDTSGSEHAGL